MVSVDMKSFLTLIFTVVMVLSPMHSLIRAQVVPYEQRLLLAHAHLSNSKPEEVEFKKEISRSLLRFQENVYKKVETIDPSDLCSNLYELNLTISMACCNYTAFFISSLFKRELWALRFLDSQGKVNSGILQGDLIYPGSFDECRKVVAVAERTSSHAIHEEVVFRGQYCQAVVFKGELSKVVYMPSPSLVFGLCVPSTCEERDVTALVQKSLQLLPEQLKQYNLSGLGKCFDEELQYDAKAIASLTMCAILSIIILTGTLYDVGLALADSAEQRARTFLVPDGKHVDFGVGNMADYSASAAVKCEETPLLENTVNRIHGPGLLGKIILCFSMYTNGKKLLNTSETSESLNCIHGIRFLSMTWVILGHTVLFGITTFRNGFEEYSIMKKRWSFQAITNAPLAVDSFFLMSGLLTAALSLREMKIAGGRINWLIFYFHRFWRLTPPYMLVMMTYIPLFQYWYNGPFWPQHGLERRYCVQTWWANLLYVNNFLSDMTNQKFQCMPWTWYLSNDMQFFIVSPLILLPLYRSRRLGAIAIGILFLGSFIATGVISTVNHLPATIFNSNINITIDYYNLYYIKPYCRIGPYLVGMLYGYTLYQTERRIEINKHIALVFWAVAAVCCLSVLYGIFDPFHKNQFAYSLLAFYNTVHRSVWAVGLGWVIFACATGHGGFINRILSWTAFVPLSRLTYCVYLIHPIVIELYFLSDRYLTYATVLNTIYVYLANICVCYGLALFVSMAFESPMIRLEKLFMKKKDA